MRSCYFAIPCCAFLSAMATSQIVSAQPPQYSPTPAILGVFGNMLNEAQQAQINQQRQAVAAAWSATDPRITGCIQNSYHISVPQLVQNAIAPSDPRISGYVTQCSQAITDQQVREQQEAAVRQKALADAEQAKIARQQAAQTAAIQAQANAEQARIARQQAQQAAIEQAQAEADARAQLAKKQADDAEQAREDAQRTAAATAEEKKAADLAAQQAADAQAQKVTALYVEFQNSAVVPNDTRASLLNYSTFGSDSGTSDSFWAPKDKSSSAFALYQKGETLQEPVKTVRELDLSTLDPAKFFVKPNSNGVEVISSGTRLASCQTCDKHILEARWMDFFAHRAQ